LGCSGARIPKYAFGFFSHSSAKLVPLRPVSFQKGEKLTSKPVATDDDVVLDELSTNCLDSIFGDFLYWIKTAADVALLEGLEIALPWRNAPASKLECWDELGTQVWIVVQLLLHDAL
jgi:hypothetical protein